MAVYNKKHSQNREGSLFVDTSCIDCETCYHLAPELFKEADDHMSFVFHQPETQEAWQKAKQALVSCPTHSIGVKDPPTFFKDIPTELPLLIYEDVYYCGYTSPNSYGASSYLIKRREGNVLIDSPKFHPHLVQALERMGGIDLMILTHQDDVADHALFAQHFQCSRVIHEQEITPSTCGAEIILKGSDDVSLDDSLQILMVPGHTKGHIAILYRGRFLFTGDHLFFNHYDKELTASQSHCWFSWDEQIRSTEKLLGYDFEWVLPGHGGWGHIPPRAMKLDLKRLIASMEKR